MRAGEHGAGGIIGEAEVDDIHGFIGHGGYKAVLARTRQIDYLASCHATGVDIGGIRGIQNRYAATRCEQFAQVAQVASGAIGYEDLIQGELYATRRVVMVYYLAAEPLVAQFGTVATEGLGMREVIYGAMHSISDDSR